MHASESDRCRRLVNPDQRGGFGLRNLVASATVQNESMDQRQVERAQKKLDSEYAGKGMRASLIYEVFRKTPQPDGAKAPSRKTWEKVQLREPDAELDTLWAPERCNCHCGCRAELGDGEGSRCKDCRSQGPRHRRLKQSQAEQSVVLGRFWRVQSQSCWDPSTSAAQASVVSSLGQGWLLLHELALHRK
ncbi:unnamed protein product [Symbiodinium necroappetens]|uniref:Uncharacterized protein n=1 Tax=Symbiodinium necroappetens TaxID=1628268 RepID=A0A812NT25_9DINO|nr:unnamed protein product [Symbiodinium necroappetens]